MKSVRFRVLVLAMLLCLPVMSGQAPLQKPVLYVVHADWCVPCKVFDKVFVLDKSFSDALRDAFEIRSLNWDVPAQNLIAMQLGVKRVPTFVVVRADRRIRCSEGFASSMEDRDVRKAQADLMSELGVEWPRVRTEISGEAPQVQAPRPTPITASGSAVDQVARDGVTKLITQSKDLQTEVADVKAQVAGVRSEVSQTKTELSQQLRESHDSTHAELSTITDRFRETIERTIIQPSPAKPPATDVSTVATKAEDGPNISTEISDSPTAGKWLKLLGWVGTTGVTLAAPEYALPLSVGLTAAGYLVNRVRRRRAARAPAALGHVSNPITISDRSPVQTDTKFVVHETDIEGEAYKEAIRRVGNQNRESQPHVMDLLKQVDGVAQQLAHGRRIVRRPKVEPTSESV